MESDRFRSVTNVGLLDLDILNIESNKIDKHGAEYLSNVLNQDAE